MHRKRDVNIIVIILIIIISIFIYFVFYNKTFLSPFSGESEKDDPGSGQRPQFQKVTPQVCGNGVLELGEECDDGNLLNDDGCSQFCEVEEGWLCSRQSPSTCSPDPTKVIFVDYQILTQSCTNYNIAARSCGGGNYLAYKTLQTAADVISSGKIVLVRDGIYKEQLRISRFGASSEWITFKNFNGETVIIDGENTRSNGIRIERSGADNSYLLINGFEIKNANSHGIHSEEINFIQIQNNRIHNNGGFGVSIRGGDDILIENNEVYSNRGEGVRAYWRDTNANKALRNIVRKNIIYNNNDVQRGGEDADGIAFFGADDGVIEYNLLFDNSDDGIDVSGHSNVFSDNNIIRYNIAFYNGFPITTNGDGNGIKVSTNNGGGNLVHHNLAIGNRRAGFDQDIEPGNDANEFYNNVAYKNGLGPSDRRLGFVIEGSGTEQGRATLYNNIGWNNDPNLLDRGDLYTSNRGIDISDYNDWQRYYYASPDPGHEEGANTIRINPLFVNPDININTNYQTQSISEKYNLIYSQIKSAFSLQQFSPAIDSATIISNIHCPTSGQHTGQNCVEWFGSAPDMGAFEYIL